MCDLCDMQKDFRAGNVADTHMAFLCDQFRELYATLQIKHWLDYLALPLEEILQVYGSRVCHRHWYNLPEVRTDSVSAAWQAIAMVHILDGRPDPQKPRGSSSCNLDIRLSCQICTYSFQYPPTSLQKPYPLGFVLAASKGEISNPKNQCLADLVQIGLYFCLRSCEYTKTNSHQRTTQFRLRDIQFQDGRCTITFDAPASRLLNALVVTLFLNTQKNYFRRETISMKNTRLLWG